MRKKRKHKKRRGSSRKTSWSRRLLKMLFLVFLVSLVPLSLYIVELEKIVTEKFEGKRWLVPARVYARSLELYPGARMTPEMLSYELSQLGYRKVAKPERSGTWSANGNRILLHSRSFQFWDDLEPSRQIDVRFDNDRIRSLTDFTGKQHDLVRLDPLEIGSIYPNHNEDRVIVHYEEIPEMLEKSLLVMEDRRFYSHFGVDIRGTSRAIYKTLIGARLEGGSTITQQFVKNFMLTHERKLTRKLKEALMALILDYKYEKEEILTAYVNEIYLGQDGNRGIHGFGLACDFFFGVPIDEIQLHQAALLIGILPAPSKYNPRRNPEQALKRRDLVLSVLFQQGLITESQAEAAKQKPLDVIAKRKSSGSNATAYPAYLDLVKRQLKSQYNQEDLYSDGLKIFTSFDPWVQKSSEERLSNRLDQLEKGHRLPQGSLEAASVMLSPQNGEVLSLIGGRHANYAGFNRALDATRQIGSLVKPAVYLAALRRPYHYSLATKIKDEKVSLKNPGGKRWTPSNYDKKEHGDVSLETALAKSYNLATVNLGLDVGLRDVISTLQRLGLKKDLRALPSLLLGAINLTPFEVAQIYQGLASGGYHTPLSTIRSVLNHQGKPLNRTQLVVSRKIEEGPAYLITSAMQKVVTDGTARWLNTQISPKMRIAGKTGTTDNLRDSWFAGFSGNYVAVVWVGRDDNTSSGLSGSTGALRVWADIMQSLSLEPVEFYMPDTVQMVMIDSLTGLLAGTCSEETITKPFIKGFEPLQETPCFGEGIDDLISAQYNRNNRTSSPGFRDNDGHPISDEYLDDEYIESPKKSGKHFFWGLFQ